MNSEIRNECRAKLIFLKFAGQGGVREFCKLLAIVRAGCIVARAFSP